MGIFATRAHKHAADTFSEQQTSENSFAALYQKNKSTLLKDLNELLGETFIEENLTVYTNRPDVSFTSDTDEVTVKIAIAPNGTNPNAVGTYLVFDVDYEYAEIIPDHNDNHGHIELKGKRHNIEDLHKIFDRWDKFTQ